MMVEGDPDTMEFVTFEHVTVDTAHGQVTRRVEVPLQPLEIEQQPSTSQLGSLSTEAVVGDGMAGIGSDIGIDGNNAKEDIMLKPATKNKVLEVLYYPRNEELTQFCSNKN